MAVDRLLPVSTTPGAVSGNNYMDAVQEEVTGLWDRAICLLSSISGTNTLTASVTPALTAGLVNGMRFELVPVATNTLTTVTLDVGSTGAKTIVDLEGNAPGIGTLKVNAHYILRYDSGLDKYVCLTYLAPATGGQGMFFLSAQDASGSTSIDFTTNLDNTYDAYEIKATLVKAVTDGVDFAIRVGTGGGPTWQTGANYAYANTGRDTAGATGSQSTTATYMQMNPTTLGNAADEWANVNVRFANPEATERASFYWEIIYANTATTFSMATGAGRYNTTATAITGVRFLMSSGNISSGHFAMYGYKKS